MPQYTGTQAVQALPQGGLYAREHGLSSDATYGALTLALALAIIGLLLIERDLLHRILGALSTSNLGAKSALRASTQS